MPTYAIQRVSNDSPIDIPGETDFDSFMQVVEAFPWAAQHRQWNETQEGPLPAVVLQDKLNLRELWVISLGAEPNTSWLLHAVSMQLKKPFFGKAKLEQDRVTLDLDRRGEVDLLCRFFCESRYEELDRTVAELAKRDS